MAKSKIWILFFIVSLVFMMACSEESSRVSKEKKQNKISGYDNRLGNPADYFPTDIGNRWEYEICIGDIEPIAHRVTSWPQNGKKILILSRSRFVPLLSCDNLKNKFSLIIRVKQSVENAGPYKWNPVEIEIEKDDLGIYEYVQNLYFIHTHDYSLAMQIKVFSPDIPGAPRGNWGSWNQENGYSEQLMFFAEQPMIQKSLFKNDKLLFMGLDNEYLHFIRIVDSQKNDNGEDVLSAAFTEDLWYQKGKGLVKLVQIINNHISMTWNLKKFDRALDI